LLQRLALALEEADSATRLRDAPPAELELRGLTPAELELIRAYLDRDLHWLQGWHAAAEELALLEQMPQARTAKAGRPAGAGKAALKAQTKIKPLLKRRQQLCCALCGNSAEWQRGEGVLPCTSCGSKLFRTIHPR
jgi:ribosomal protein L37AE/L43A